MIASLAVAVMAAVMVPAADVSGYRVTVGERAAYDVELKGRGIGKSARWKLYAASWKFCHKCSAP